MTETSAAPVVASPMQEKASAKTVTTKKTAMPKTAKSKKPSAAEMVYDAVETLADRGGSSLQAIKKYLTVTYLIDVEKQALFIRKYLKSAVAAGTLIQTKGKGANGSFKLPVDKIHTTKSRPNVNSTKKTVAPKKSPVTKKAVAKTAVKQPTVLKKSAAKKPVTVQKKTSAKVVKSKSSPKAKKAVKAPTSKPKAPKPKKTIVPRAVKNKKPTSG